MGFPSIDDIVRFFTSAITSIEDFAFAIADGVVVEVINKLETDVELLQEALDATAENLPMPDPELKNQVTTLYNVALAVRDYQQKELRSFMSRRYKTLLKQAKDTYSTKLLVAAIKELVSLEWSAGLSFILSHLSDIIVGGFAAEELYKSISTDLAKRQAAKALSQKNPRKYVNGPHRTRKR